MKSSELLLFIKERFVNVYKEHPNTDYLIALKNLADEINDKDFKISFLQGQNNELSAENQFLNDEYQQFIEMLPNDARYLDLPDGGSVHPTEQMRRMLADLNNQNAELVAQVDAIAKERDALAAVIVHGETKQAAQILAKRDAVQFAKHIKALHVFDANTTYGTIKAVSVSSINDYAAKLTIKAAKR